MALSRSGRDKLLAEEDRPAVDFWISSAENKVLAAVWKITITPAKRTTVTRHDDKGRIVEMVSQEISLADYEVEATCRLSQH